jgi:hypothetical protein
MKFAGRCPDTTLIWGGIPFALVKTCSTDWRILADVTERHMDGGLDAMRY